ncbi:hypothetical protein Q1695_013060 [Nippostrongylus brasiliensis]|nr:hypothetical protein Q1695_013060 [Nippostrongylus brasiliensis]
MERSLLLLLSFVIVVSCLNTNMLVAVNRNRDVVPSTSSQESFPGRVALRPDYTFWSIMKTLRNFFDSNTERRIRTGLPPDFRDLRSRRMLLTFRS